MADVNDAVQTLLRALYEVRNGLPRSSSDAELARARTTVQSQAPADAADRSALRLLSVVEAVLADSHD